MATGWCRQVARGNVAKARHAPYDGDGLWPRGGACIAAVHNGARTPAEQDARPPRAAIPFPIRQGSLLPPTNINITPISEGLPPRATLLPTLPDPTRFQQNVLRRALYLPRHPL